ncbi:dihydrofolate reductase family protein [Algoriphagus lutimaris]|uniref:dihydrofolate reductase family protein n=1 Tax=Algoriphagus lutimaris TaxID=613197 RepID=UPI00196B5009|nr:dihydrofolate reductase family protein [Algoriphagus lutimaris]MBN3521082.1 dihydrofolate reductase family protein [Algoriphagus lutimaris]
MGKIIYYVASSLDGFISGPNEDTRMFVPGGKGIEKYFEDLKKFKTVIMGRKTYEFGYKFGLQPGQPAYQHMQHHIFSDSLTFENKAESVHVEPRKISRVQEIKASASSDIYLCGGGIFAGWLLDHHLIDQLKIKLNPIILGDGIRLFGSSKTKGKLDLMQDETFENGLKIITYSIRKN